MISSISHGSLWFIHRSIDTQLVGFVDDMQESG